jgi:glutaredoxin
MKLFCPWCKRTDLPLHRLKIHVKYCDKTPRPRGKKNAQRRLLEATGKGSSP